MSFSKFYAVIPAAGSGTRMNSNKNKQFLELSGIPVIVRTLLVFQNSPLISGIVVSVRDFEKDELKMLCQKYEISKLTGIVSGGDTRQRSVKNSLLYLAEKITSGELKDSNLSGDISNGINSSCDNSSTDNESCESSLSNSYVLIHDGARPFVSDDIILRCADCVVDKRGCGAGVIVKDTIKQTGIENKIEKTLDRNNLWAIQTPQAFALDDILALHNKAESDKLNFTDDTALYEYYGKDSYMVEGSYSNIKITTPEDLLLGEMILKGKI